MYGVSNQVLYINYITLVIDPFLGLHEGGLGPTGIEATSGPGHTNSSTTWDIHKPNKPANTYINNNKDATIDL